MHYNLSFNIIFIILSYLLYCTNLSEYNFLNSMYIILYFCSWKKSYNKIKLSTYSPYIQKKNELNSQRNINQSDDFPNFVLVLQDIFFCQRFTITMTYSHSNLYACIVTHKYKCYNTTCAYSNFRRLPLENAYEMVQNWFYPGILSFSSFLGVTQRGVRN